jgi:hypothetical protein
MSTSMSAKFPYFFSKKSSYFFLKKNTIGGDFKMFNMRPIVVVALCVIFAQGALCAQPKMYPNMHLNYSATQVFAMQNLAYGGQFIAGSSESRSRVICFMFHFSDVDFVNLPSYAFAQRWARMGKSGPFGKTTIPPGTIGTS